jgi:hypothetical protein
MVQPVIVPPLATPRALSPEVTSRRAIVFARASLMDRSEADVFEIAKDQAIAPATITIAATNSATIAA